MSYAYETKVYVFNEEPDAYAMLDLMVEHDNITDTQLKEWRVSIEKLLNEPSNISLPLNRYRWEVTLKRRII